MPVRDKRFFCSPKFPDWFGTHPASSHAWWGYLLRGRVPRIVRFTASRHSVLRLRMGEAVFLHVVHVMERDNCTSVFSHIGVVSLLPAEVTAPFVMFQDFIYEEKLEKY
jgi:hypothetical protein